MSGRVVTGKSDDTVILLIQVKATCFPMIHLAQVRKWGQHHPYNPKPFFHKIYTFVWNSSDAPFFLLPVTTLPPSYHLSVYLGIILQRLQQLVQYFPLFSKTQDNLLINLLLEAMISCPLFWILASCTPSEISSFFFSQSSICSYLSLSIPS